MNKNVIIDKCIQELQLELLEVQPAGGVITSLELQEAVLIMNHRIRSRGLTAKEILMQRDQHTGEQLWLDSEHMAKQQHHMRERNHTPSAISKAKGNKIASKCNVNIGDLVYLKMEGNNLYYHRYNKDNATLQKLNERLFAAKKYELTLTHTSS